MKLVKNVIVALVITILFLIPISCYETIVYNGSGEIIEETRDLQTSNSIINRTSGVLYITQGSPEEIRIKTDENLMDKIITTISNNKIIISSKENISPTILEFYVTLEEITSLSLQGSGEIIAITIEQSNDIWLSNSGSGSINIQKIISKNAYFALNGSGEISVNEIGVEQNLSLTNDGSGIILSSKLTVGKLTSRLNGSGNIIIADGGSNFNFLSSSGSGEINLIECPTLVAEVELSGSGNIYVNANDSLKGSIMGSGNIYYRGNPDIEIEITGSGELIKSN